MIRHLIHFLVIACVLSVASVTHADDDASRSSRVPLPVIKIFKGDKCVEPEEVMRRDHMEMILHQRDKTVHQGIRTTQYSLKQCVNCHANPETNSVLGKDGFCLTCHQYAAVSIDCFTCHARHAEPELAVNPPATHLSDMMNQSNVDAVPAPSVPASGAPSPAGVRAP